VARASKTQANSLKPLAEHQAHLFDKFSIAAREGLAGESPTGLFITQQIVRLPGGRIWVESWEQEGTTFCIDL